MKIMIDPGHGGKDPGAVNKNIELQEKDVALDISKRLADLLETDNHEVIMTRDSDRFIGINDRAMKANSEKADIFISIHTNGFNNPSAEGIETLHWPNSKKGAELADNIQKQLINKLDLVDRGLKARDNLGVLRNTSMPAVLLEIGFITNPKEAKLMQQDQFIYNAASAIKAGVDQYARGS